MKKLDDILKNVEVQKLVGPGSTVIDAITFDSRQVKSGQLFVAIRGTSIDGHKFIITAI